MSICQKILFSSSPHMIPDKLNPKPQQHGEYGRKKQTSACSPRLREKGQAGHLQASGCSP